MKWPDTHRETETETETESFLSIPQSVKFIADCKIESQHLTNTWFKLKLHAWLSPRSKMLLDPVGMLGCWQGGVTPFKVQIALKYIDFRRALCKVEAAAAAFFDQAHGTFIFKVLLLVSHVHESVLQVAGAGLGGWVWVGREPFSGVARRDQARRKAETFYFLILFSSNTNLILL